MIVVENLKQKVQSCSLCLLEEILCILRSYPTSTESDQLDLLCCQPEPFADASTPLNGSFSASTHWRLSARSGALICMHEITWQVRLQFHTRMVTGKNPKHCFFLCTTAPGLVMRDAVLKLTNTPIRRNVGAARKERTLRSDDDSRHDGDQRVLLELLHTASTNDAGGKRCQRRRHWSQ